MPTSKELKRLGNYGERAAREFLRREGYEVYCYGSDLIEPMDKERALFSEILDNRIHFDCRKPDFDKILSNADFHFLNSVIHQYIVNLHSENLDNDPLPYSGPVIFEAMKEGRVEEAERMKDANRASMKKSSFPKGHPGRFDFVCIKDGVYFATEVKVNSSKLSYWQKLRLTMLQYFGVPSLLVKVSVNKEDFLKVYSGKDGEVSSSDIKVEKSPVFKGVEMPLLEDVKRVLQAYPFASPHLDEKFPDAGAGR